MNIKYTTKNIKFPGALKAFAENQLMSIAKISGDVIDAEVIVNQEKINFKVEIILKTKLDSYHIKNRDQKLKQALRSALSKIKSQAKKNKEKHKKEKKRINKKGFLRVMKRRRTPPILPGEQLNGITVSDNFYRKPITVEEAIFFLKASNDNAYLFYNSETDKISVVYFSKNNNISIIEADM